MYVTKKLWIKWQTNIAHFDRKPFQYRSLTQAMKMHNNWRENLLFGDWVDLVNSDSCNLLSKLSFLKSFCPFIRQPRFGTSVNNFTASTFNGFIHIFSHHCRRYSDFVQILHLVFHDGNQRSYHNNRKWHSILPSFQRTLYSRKKLENKNFSKASRWEIAKTSILPTTCFKQLLCSSLLASTFGKSLSAVFVASLNSAWRHVESVITAISHFSLWSKTLHCWQKLSKSTNQRVYQDLVYRNALLLKILTSVPAPLSPVPLYFSSVSLLRTTLHYLNAWNRLWPVWPFRSVGPKCAFPFAKIVVPSTALLYPAYKNK